MAAMVCLLSLAGAWGAFAQEKGQDAADPKMDCSKASSECLLACFKCHKTCMENAPPVAACASKWTQPPNKKVTGSIFPNAGVFYPGIALCIPKTVIKGEGSTC